MPTSSSTSLPPRRWSFWGWSGRGGRQWRASRGWTWWRGCRPARWSADPGCEQLSVRWSAVGCARWCWRKSGSENTDVKQWGRTHVTFLGAEDTHPWHSFPPKFPKTAMTSKPKNTQRNWTDPMEKFGTESIQTYTCMHEQKHAHTHTHSHSINQSIKWTSLWWMHIPA